MVPQMYIEIGDEMIKHLMYFKNELANPLSPLRVCRSVMQRMKVRATTKI